MRNLIRYGVKIEDSKIKLAFLTLLVFFAISTSGWAGPAPPPSNDDCEDAIGVGVPSMTGGTSIDSTADTAPDCGSLVTTTPGVWYTVFGTGNTMTASTCNDETDYDSELSVYCDACNTLTCIGGNDDAGQTCSTSEFHSTFSWCSQTGVTYRIFVHGHAPFELGDTGDFQLDISDDGQACDAAVECPLPPPPIVIPTLNQYGMITMAGLLGMFAVIGLFIMRRRNVVMPSS